MHFRLFLSVLLLIPIISCNNKEEKENSLEDILWAATWSPDDGYINVGGNSGKIYWYSGNDYTLLDTISTPQTISNLEWAPGNDRLLVTTQTSSEPSYLFDPVSKEKVYLDSLLESGARGLTWNNDGSRFALGDNEGRVLIYDQEGNIEKIIQADPKSITGIDWHPDKDIIVSVGSKLNIIDLDNDTTITADGREVEILMLCVQWHPSGDFFVTGDYGDYDLGLPSMLQFWGANGEKLKEIKGMKSEVRRIRWTEDGEKLAVASDMAYLFDVDGTMVRQNDLGNKLWGVDWNSPGNKLVVSSETGDIYVLNDKLQVVRKIQ